MAEDVNLEPTDAAEKAYAAASEKVAVAKPAPVQSEPVEAEPVAAAAVQSEPEALLVETADAAVEPAPAPKPAKAPAKPKAAKPVAAKAPEPIAKAKVVKPAPSKPAQPVAAKPQPVKAQPVKAVAAKKPAAVVKPKPAVSTSKSNPTSIFAKLKDSTMATTTKTKQTAEDFTAKTKKTAEEFTAKVQSAVKDAQARAKAALEKGQALLGDSRDITKANVEAIRESGKILSEGFKTLRQDYVERTKSTLQTVQADVKELAAVKSPKEFVELQGSLVRKYFDSAVENNSKRTEAVVKLANDAFQPISSRVSVVREKFKKAA